MSVPIETSSSLFTGNGATVDFVTGFYFRLTSEVVVTLTPSGGTPVVQTEGVHYTVAACSDFGQADGEVTMVTAPPAASELKIERTVPFTQATSLRQAGEFDPAAHEDQFDEVVFQTQQLHRRLSALESAGAVGSVVGGNGLSFAGTTLNVGAGAGIQANADTVEVLYGAAAAIADVTKAAESAGVANTAARSDHKHDISTAVAGAVVAGAAASEGAATSLARSDHGHSVAVGAPVAVDAAAAVTGASGNFSDANHKHVVTTAAPVEITDSTNASGASTALAAAQHTHAHGNRGGGTLHAEATSGAAGFQSAADKASMTAIGTVALLSKVAASSTAPQSIATGLGGGAVLTGYTETLDSDSEFNPATGVYTAKQAGNVLVLGQVLSGNVAWPALTRVYLGIRKNGVTVGVLCAHFLDTGVTRQAIFEGTRFFTVAIGDTIDLYVAHDQGGNVNFSGYLAIHRFV